MAKLVLSRGGSIVFQCFVDRDRLSVGRDSHNHIVVDDASVSREHAAVIPVGNDHILEDLASANGTFVNGKRLRRRILQHGDVIELGSFHLRYLNPKVASDVDLAQTMFIAGLPEAQVSGTDGPPAMGGAPTRTSGKARTHFPKGRVWMGAGPRAGEVIELTRVVTMFGRLGEQAVVARRPLGYYLTLVDGKRLPRVNGRAIGREPCLLRHGDVVEVGDERLEFTLDEIDRRS
jgi:hypothetical protein